MGVQRYTLASGAVRYRARVKSHGRYIATRVFERKADAVAWEQDQRRRLRLGEWIDPRRGQVPLSVVAADWLGSRSSVKRRTRESDESAWRNYIGPRFGNWPVGSITAAEVSSWVGSLVARGLAPSTATRALATLRSILAFAVADARVQHNVAASVRNPTSGRARREGQALTLDELETLTEACKGRYRDVVPVLALAGLRWGELAGLQVGDRVSVPGPGLRLRRAMLAGGGGGALYLDTLKNNRARTVPLVVGLTCGRPPGLSGTSRGHLSRPGHLTRRTTRRRRTKVPGESGCSGGAAYRNRTDDLRITRGMLPASARATCTDSTEIAVTALAALGLSTDPFHDPFHAYGLCVTPSCSVCAARHANSG